MNQEMTAALDRIHKGHKIILREITRICRKHGIHYYLDSGTLIGAIRHKSAIPWDDDADIAMLRSDFEKFRRVAADELGPAFRYVEPDQLGNAVFDFVPRVVLLDSSIRPDSSEEQYYGNGIYNHLMVDIFIVDDVSDSDLFHLFCRGLLTIFYGFGLGHRYELDFSNYPGVTGVVVRVLAAIGKFLPARFIVRQYDRISKMETGKNGEKNRCYFGNYLFGDIKLLYQKEWFGEPVDVLLDGETFPGPKNWHQCLELQYGDYMKLPPVEKRVQPHIQPQYVSISHPDMEDAD